MQPSDTGLGSCDGNRACVNTATSWDSFPATVCQAPAGVANEGCDNLPADTCSAPLVCIDPWSGGCDTSLSGCCMNVGAENQPCKADNLRSHGGSALQIGDDRNFWPAVRRQRLLQQQPDLHRPDKLQLLGLGKVL
jgi:hypothetical protein